MPMPPPKPTTEGPRDRQLETEMAQIVRALRVNGPVSAEELGGMVGAPYWDEGRFDRALAFVLADGLAVRDAEGRLSTV